MALLISNMYLERGQMTDNAQYIADYLTGNGWTQNACGDPGEHGAGIHHESRTVAGPQI